MRDPWRMDGALVTEALLPLAADDTAARALDAARAFCRGELDEIGLAAVHRQVETAINVLRASDWARAPLYAAEWATAVEPLWHTEMDPWSQLERARASGPLGTGTGTGSRLA